MEVTVHADLVAAPRGLSHEIGMALGNPAQKEDRGPVPACVEKLEDPHEVGLDPRWKGVPSPRVRKIVVTADEKPVLDVDGQDPRCAARGAERGDRGLRHAPGIVAISCQLSAFSLGTPHPRVLAESCKLRAES